MEEADSHADPAAAPVAAGKPGRKRKPRSAPAGTPELSDTPAQADLPPPSAEVPSMPPAAAAAGKKPGRARKRKPRSAPTSTPDMPDTPAQANPPPRSAEVPPSPPPAAQAGEDGGEPPWVARDPQPPSPQGHGIAYALIALFLLALAFGGWGLWRTFAPAPGDARSQAARIAELEQRVATLSRSDQISRDANRDLQSTLADRDEEIASLRADVAFYERFVGATAQRHGLAVHDLKLQAQDAQVWKFTATLTQNLNRGAVSSGRLTLAVEGSVGGRMQKAAWATLRQQAGAAGLPYSFKYFQQVEGDLLLPPGMKPVRVVVRLQPASGAAVEQSFAWADAIGEAQPGA